MRSYCDAANLQWPEALILSVDRTLLRSSLLAALDTSAGDITSARSDLETGLSIARAANRQAGTIYFLLSLGDLLSSPDGDIHTLGYDLASDTTARGIRQYDPNGGGTLTPIAPADLEAAETKYSEAQTIARGIPGFSGTHEFALRTAYIASMVVSHPPQVYRAAALSAVKDGSVRMAAIYQTTYALIETSPTVFSDAVTSLMENSDIGGIVSCAEMARGYASRRAFSGYLNVAGGDLRMAIASLNPTRLYHAIADLQDELARTYGAALRYKSGARYRARRRQEQKCFIAEAQKSAHFDQVLVDSEKESESVSVNFLVGEFSVRASADGGEVWDRLQNQFNELLPELTRTLNVPDYQEFLHRQFPELQHKMAIRSSEQAWFTSALNCEAFLSQYPRYEAAAQAVKRFGLSPTN